MELNWAHVHVIEWGNVITVTCARTQLHCCVETCLIYAHQEEEDEEIDDEQISKINVNINTESHMHSKHFRLKINRPSWDQRGEHASKQIQHNTNWWEILLAFKSNEIFLRSSLIVSSSSSSSAFFYRRFLLLFKYHFEFLPRNQNKNKC